MTSLVNESTGTDAACTTVMCSMNVDWLVSEAAAYSINLRTGKHIIDFTFDLVIQ
jgi:hypothetical protein